MKDAPKLRDVTLGSLINRLSEGRFEIPNFQRTFVWEPDKINDLMRSIFCDYYIGSLLLWKGGDDQNFDSLSCEPISGYEGDEGNREHIVLDGQQRLSAIYYAFFSPNKTIPKTKSLGSFFIDINYFMQEEFQDAFKYRLERKRTLVKPEEQYQSHCFPLSILGEEEDDVRYNWFKEYKKHWKLHEMDANETGNIRDSAQYRRYQNHGERFAKVIKEALRDYTISYIELDQNLGIDKICSIFTKLNSTGKLLGTFDLLNAMLTPKGIYLKEMWDDASPKLEFVNAPRLNTYILRVMSILLQDGNCSSQYLYRLIPDADLVVDRDEFMHYWSESVNAIEQSIQVLKNPQDKFGVIAAKFLPYPAMTPVFTALRISAARTDPYDQIEAFRKVRHWYWASVFTESYSDGVESTTARDFSDVSQWISGGAEPDVIRKFQNTVEHLDLHGVRQGAIYRGIINLLVLRGSFDWITGLAPNPKNINDHHIIPRRWGTREGIGNAIDTVLNRTLLSAETNQNVIGASLPNEYLPKLMDQAGEDRVRKIFESHLISPEAFDILLADPFTRDDFNKFIAVRQETIRNAIGPLLFEERLDLEPDLRAMNEAIEKIELALRACIERAVDVDEIKGLHFYPKVQVLVDAALRNPARDRDYYNTLAGKLEHFDLREIEDTLKNKQLWDRFADRFGTKEALAMKFGQLAELRNAIRHSRTADAVTRLEGEAAIKWFQKALGLEN